MTKITFEPLGVTIDAAPGEPLLDVANRAGLAIESECGGKGTCGSCMAFVIDGAVEGDSASFLPREAAEEGAVLCCRSQVGARDAVLRMKSGLGTRAKATGQFGEAPLSAPEAAKKVCRVFEPLAFRTTLSVPEPQPLDGLSDLDRLTRVLEKEVCCSRAVVPLHVLRTLAMALRRDKGLVTVTGRMDGDRLMVLDVRPGTPQAPLTGAAIDLGTTTIAVQLMDLESGLVLARATDYNDQSIRGLDVISRINYAQKPGGIKELIDLAQRSINRLLDTVARKAGVWGQDILALSVAGNTVMTHLLLGLDPEHLRLEPYTPTVLQPGLMTAAELGIAAHPLAPVHLAPAVGSYVGGDITSGAALTRIAPPHDPQALDPQQPDPESMRLYIDIGTNGEVAVGNADVCMACACSAGPAFEGGGLSCGMRAAEGAVEKVSIDPATGEPTLSVIGNVRPTGICGSGVIDLVAELFRTGWMDASGSLDRERACPRITAEGRKAAYLVATAEESASGEPIRLTEADIDNIIRAKGAIYSGCAHLIAQAGLAFTDMAEIVIAGGFGRFLDVDKAVAIGLLPDVERTKFTFLGNASLAGAVRTLLSARWRKRRDELAARVTYIDLSTDPGYMDQYTAALFLPHTDQSLFPSVKTER